MTEEKGTIQAEPMKRVNEEDKLKQFTKAFDQSLDRLWYFATLETIRKGDVYNVKAKYQDFT